METVHYLRAALRSWWVILLAIVAGGLGGYAVYATDTAEYRSSVRLVVAVETRGLDEVAARALAAQRAQALSQVAGTPPAVAAAKNDAGVPAASVSVTSAANGTDPFVSISVVSTDGENARKVADAYAGTLSTSATSLLGPSSSQFRVTKLANASVPGDPFTPVFSKDVGFGLAGGVILGVMLALLREAFNRSIRTSDELREITGLTVLGTVPHDLPKTLMPAMTDPRSSRAEAYRQVRTTLLSLTDKRPLVIAFTSAVLGEGKTSVTTNLAAVLVRAGHRVAIVDADLRRPRVAAFFEVENKVGLSQVLAGSGTLDDALVIRDEGRLAILPSGGIPANPSEALGAQAADDLLAELRRRYEFVVVDTPPLLPVTDALVLAPRVDGTVLVARLGYTSRTRVEHAMSALDRVDATVFGVVPNDARGGADGDYSYSYRYSSNTRADRDPDLAVPVERLIERRGRSSRSGSRRPAPPHPHHHDVPAPTSDES